MWRKENYIYFLSAMQYGTSSRTNKKSSASDVHVHYSWVNINAIQYSHLFNCKVYEHQIVERKARMCFCFNNIFYTFFAIHFIQAFCTAKGIYLHKWLWNWQKPTTSILYNNYVRLVLKIMIKKKTTFFLWIMMLP